MSRPERNNTYLSQKPNKAINAYNLGQLCLLGLKCFCFALVLWGCSTSQVEIGYRGKITPLRQALAKYDGKSYQKVANKLRKDLSKAYTPTEVAAINMAIRIQDCGLLGVETKYNLMQKQLGPLLTEINQNKVFTPAIKGDLMADIAEVQLQNGYGYRARIALNQLPKPTDSAQAARLDLLIASTLLAEGDNYKAKNLAYNRLQRFEQQLANNPKKDMASSNNINLMAELWIVTLEATVGTGDHIAFMDLLPKAETFFSKRLRGETNYHFLYHLARAHAYDQHQNTKLAEKAYVKVLRMVGFGGYEPDSWPVIQAESELVGMLYEKGITRSAANRAEHVINKVDRKHSGIAQCEAIKSITILREYAMRGDQDMTFNELDAILHYQDQTYQFSPRLSKQVQEIAYKLALQFDSTLLATKALNDLILLGKEIGGPRSSVMSQQVINKAFYEGLYNGHWGSCLDTFKVYWEPIIKPTYAINHPQRLALQGMYARCLDETDQLRLARRQLTDNQRAVKSTWGEKHPLYAAQVQQLGDVELSLGAYAQAEDHLVSALEIASMSENRNSPVYVATMRQLVRMYLLYGEYDVAEDFINYAISAEGKIYLTPTLLAEQSDDLAPLLAYLRGQYRNAETGFLTQLVRAEVKGIEGHAKMITPLIWLGETYLQLGDYPSAEKSALEATQYARQLYGDTSRKYFQCLAVQQKLYRLMGNLDKSIELSGQIVRKYQRVYGANHVDVAGAMTEMAKATYQKTDSARKVLPLLDAARTIYLNNFGENHPLYAEAIKNMAALYIDLEQDDSAAALLTRAAEIYRKKLGRRPVQLVEILMLLGDLARYKGQFDEANKHYDQAISLLSKNFGQIHPQLLQLRGRKARCLALNGQTSPAIKQMQTTMANYLKYFEQYFPYLSEREKARLWQQSQPEFNFFATLVIDNAEDDRANPGLLYNHCLATKGILLSNSQHLRNQLLKSMDKATLAKYQEWQSNKEKLAALLAGNDVAENVNSTKLQDETDALEKELNEKSTLFASINNANKALSYTDVVKRLGANEFAVEIIRSTGYEASRADSINYIALIVGGKYNKPLMVNLGSGKYLETKAIRYYRNGMRYNFADTLSYRMFWAKMAPHFPAGCTVYLAADGVYNQLNLAGLQQHLGQFVSDNVNIVSVSNTAELIKVGPMITAKVARRGNQPMLATAAKGALLIGNPTYYTNAKHKADLIALGLNLKQLPGTEAEVRAISQVLHRNNWSVTSLIGPNAKEETIRATDIPEVLHIATHGAFVSEEDENAKVGMKAEVQAAESSLLKVGLVLAGGGELLDEDSTTNLNQRPGVLTAYEAMNMNLSRTELVVLSACETGIGHLQNGEGVYGLQRAFLVAGAKNVIFSFFKVDDKITTELMTNFYQSWAGGLTKRAAFRAAQQSIRSKYPENPTYWASFTMLGI